MGDQEEHQEQDLESYIPEEELINHFTATTEDGTQIVLTAEQLQSYQEAMEAQQAQLDCQDHQVDEEVDPDAETQIIMEGVEGEQTQEMIEGQHYVETQTIIDEHGNPQTVVTGASLQDLLTLHAVDADGNYIATENHIEGIEEGEHLVTEDGQHVESYEPVQDDDETQYQEEGAVEMMETGETIEEVIADNGQTEEQSYEINDNYTSHEQEILDSKADLMAQPFLSVRDSVFNPVTGTLQPISSATPQTTATTPTSPTKAKKAKEPQQIKYVIQQAGGDGQPQQFVLNADQLQGLLQGTGNALASGQKIVISAPSGQKAKSRSPTKILPAPVPIGDQLQQQVSSTGTQKILLKSGNKYISIPSGPSTPGTTQLIQIPGPGGKMQYLRVIPNKTQSIAPLNKIAIAPMSSKSKTIQLAPKPSSGQTFIIPSGASGGDFSGLTGAGFSNYVVLPNYIIKTDKTSEQAQAEATMLALQQNLAQTQAGFESFRSLLEPNGMRPRKPCNCTKSQCLKLYCDCFANGEFCHLCNCTNCYNNLNHEEDRQKAIKMVLERNPGAFRPKIGKSSQTGEAHERRHNKGCNCRRSGCLKNYCECYEAKIFCSGICKCSGCKNCIENIPTGLPNGVGVEQHFAGAGTSHRQTLKDLAEAAEVRVQQQNQVRSKMKAQWQEVSTQNNLGAMVPPCVFRYPHGTISYEVVTSSVELLIARSESSEKQRATDGEMEKLVVEEFGDCLASLMELGISPTND